MPQIFANTKLTARITFQETPFTATQNEQQLCTQRRERTGLMHRTYYPYRKHTNIYSFPWGATSIIIVLSIAEHTQVLNLEAHIYDIVSFTT